MAADSWEKAADKMENASYYQLVMGGAILLDKARLLAGESTENIAVLHHHELVAVDGLAAALGQALLDSNKSPTSGAKKSNDTEAL